MYARSGTLSQVGYQRDYTSLYQGKLKDMKYAYNQLSSLKEYYEVTSQFLYIPDFPLEDHFLISLRGRTQRRLANYLLEQGRFFHPDLSCKTVQIS